MIIFNRSALDVKFLFSKECLRYRSGSIWFACRLGLKSSFPGSWVSIWKRSINLSEYLLIFDFFDLLIFAAKCHIPGLWHRRKLANAVLKTMVQLSTRKTASWTRASSQRLESSYRCVLCQSIQSGSIASLAEILSLIHKAMQLFRRHSYISLSKSKTR